MSVLPRTAVIVVHGIGEQTPLETLRNFVGLTGDIGILGRKSETDGRTDISKDRKHVFVGPDSITKTSYARRISFDHTHRIPPADDVPDDLEQTSYGHTTHFYEYYWAYRFRDTAWRHLTPLLFRLLFTSRDDVFNGALKGRPMRPVNALCMAVSLLLASVTAVAAIIESQRVASGLPGWGWVWIEVVAFVFSVIGLGFAQASGLLTFVKTLAGIALGLAVTTFAALCYSHNLGGASAGRSGWSLLLGFVTSLAVPFLGGVALKWLGDAARYMSNHPDNVTERETIRADLISLLRELELRIDPVTKRAQYERIVLVGHSLGSVIAYDALCAYWADVNQSFYFPDRGDDHSPEEPLGGLVARLETWSGTDPQDWIALQRPLQTALASSIRWHGGRLLKAPRRWIVSDLVTVGSPLCHAEALLAHGKKEWNELKELRLVAASPPAKQRTGLSQTDHPFRYRAWRGRSYVTKLHHQAVFAVTTWTNVYFSNDLVGGPLKERFGDGVDDRPIEAGPATPWGARHFSHTKYWGTKKSTAGFSGTADLSRAILRDIAIRQHAVLVVSGPTAKVKAFRQELVDNKVALVAPPEQRAPELIELRVLRVAPSLEPNRDWTWLGLDRWFEPAMLETILGIANGLDLVVRFSDRYHSQEPTPRIERGSSGIGQRLERLIGVGGGSREQEDDVVEPVAPNAAEPGEE